MKKILLYLVFSASLVSCTTKEESKADITQTPAKETVVIDNILSRRSIRSYKPEQVDKSKIDTIMQCAINAPSANNKQPWEVRVIQNADLLNKIKELGGQFYGAPTLIIVAKDKTNSFADFDSGLLTQNILLSAHSLDLGTCPLGSLARLIMDSKAKDVLASLDLPKDYEVVLAISLGYPNESPDAKPRETEKIKFID